MDLKNPYHTPSTFLLVRLEHIAIVVVCVVLTVMHIEALNWWRFIAAFVLIDLIGYLPGAIAYRRAGGGPIAPVYHYLYNVAHSYLTLGIIVAIWAYAISGFEWAMMAFPIHLSGDRGLFGNTYKPLSLSFEPAEAAPDQCVASMKAVK